MQKGSKSSSVAIINHKQNCTYARERSCTRAMAAAVSDFGHIVLKAFSFLPRMEMIRERSSLIAEHPGHFPLCSINEIFDQFPLCIVFLEKAKEASFSLPWRLKSEQLTTCVL